MSKSIFEGVFDEVVIKEVDGKLLGHTHDLEEELGKLLDKFEKHPTMP